MKTRIILPLLAAVAGIVASSVQAQVVYSTPGLAHSEDFDALDPSLSNLYQGGYEWIDNETIPGFYANQPNYFATANPAEPNRLYNLRTGSSSTNQSLGSAPGNGSGTISVGLRLTNETGQILTSFSLGYLGAQWRNSGNEIPSQIIVDWSIGASSLIDGSWTAANATFTAPHTGGTVENLDGMAPENQVYLQADVSDGFVWNPGEDLWIRWSHERHTGPNHALSIDDVTFAAIPEPSHFGIFFAGAIGAFLAVRRRFGK